MEFEHLGDLGLGEIAVIVQLKDGPLMVGQLLDLFVEFGQQRQATRIMAGVSLIEGRHRLVRVERPDTSKRINPSLPPGHVQQDLSHLDEDQPEEALDRLRHGRVQGDNEGASRPH